ncbi:MAG TPA: hypothetical protein VF117_05135, partial [Gammaproteobacteria bacterium]
GYPDHIRLEDRVTCCVPMMQVLEKQGKSHDIPGLRRRSLTGGVGHRILQRSHPRHKVKIAVNITKRTNLPLLFVFGITVLLSGCPLGGSGSSTPTTVTAFHVPEQATANSTF